MVNDPWRFFRPELESASEASSEPEFVVCL